MIRAVENHHEKEIKHDMETGLVYRDNVKANFWCILYCY